MKPFKFVMASKQSTYQKLCNLSDYATHAIQVKWQTDEDWSSGESSGHNSEDEDSSEVS